MFKLSPRQPHSWWLSLYTYYHIAVSKILKKPKGDHNSGAFNEFNEFYFSQHGREGPLKPGTTCLYLSHTSPQLLSAFRGTLPFFWVLASLFHLPEFYSLLGLLAWFECQSLFNHPQQNSSDSHRSWYKPYDLVLLYYIDCWHINLSSTVCFLFIFEFLMPAIVPEIYSNARKFYFFISIIMAFTSRNYHCFSQGFWKGSADIYWELILPPDMVLSVVNGSSHFILITY